MLGLVPISLQLTQLAYSHVSRAGEKMTDDEVDALLSGIEDSQGQVNYEGKVDL